MKNMEIIISRMHLSEKSKAVQDKVNALEIGESIEYNGKVYTKTLKDLCEVTYSSNYDSYKFSRKDVIGSYVQKVEITPNDIETVIVNSFEGGSNYWLELDTDNKEAVWNDKPKGIPYSTWATRMLLDGKTLHFQDYEDEQEKYTLTLERLIEGFKLNAEKRPFDCDLDNGDATTSDCILQYGVFGDLVYG